jgi:hypothetical protein
MNGYTEENTLEEYGPVYMGGGAAPAPPTYTGPLLAVDLFSVTS